MELNVDAVSDRAGFMLCLKNLPEIVRRKNHGVFLVGTVFGRIPNIEQVGAERQMRPVFFDNPERQQTDALRLLNPFYKVSRSEFFPLRGEFLRRREPRSEQDNETQPDYGNETTIHFLSPPNVRILAPGRGFVMLKSPCLNRLRRISVAQALLPVRPRSISPKASASLNALRASASSFAFLLQGPQRNSLQNFPSLQRSNARDYRIILIHFLKFVPQTWPIASEVLQTLPDRT